MQLAAGGAPGAAAARPQLRRLCGAQAAAAAASARSRTRSVACFARRTKSGGGDRDRDSRKSGGGSSSSTRSKATSSGAERRPSGGGGGGGRPNGQQQRPGLSQLEDFVRSTPGLNRFLDGTLILGDAVMVLATEVSSERLPFEQVPALASVAIASWIGAGAILGDYAMTPDPDENPLSNALGWPIFQAVVNSMITWAVSMVLAIFGFSWLVSNYVVDPELVLEVARDGMLSPQLEISVALLITMSCWRGMAARLRL